MAACNACKCKCVHQASISSRPPLEDHPRHASSARRACCVAYACDAWVQGWQLPGIWAGMVLLVFCNGALDGALVLSKRSPIAGTAAASGAAPAPELPPLDDQHKH